MLKKQYIAFLFASVLLTNLGHNMVPHHHHFDSILSHQGCHEQDEGEYALHKGDPASHCHAYNGIEYFPAPEKPIFAKPVKLIKSIGLPQVVLLDRSATHQHRRRPSRDLSPFYPFLLGSSSGLRAPPPAS